MYSIMIGLRINQQQRQQQHSTNADNTLMLMLRFISVGAMLLLPLLLIDIIRVYITVLLTVEKTSVQNRRALC